MARNPLRPGALVIIRIGQLPEKATRLEKILVSVGFILQMHRFSGRVELAHLDVPPGTVGAFRKSGGFMATKVAREECALRLFRPSDLEACAAGLVVDDIDIAAVGDHELAYHGQPNPGVPSVTAAGEHAEDLLT